MSENDSRGQMAIGETPLIRSAALAAEGKKVRVAPARRDKETVADLLLRLDTALGKAIAENGAVDEVLPEIQRRRSPGNLRVRLSMGDARALAVDLHPLTFSAADVVTTVPAHITVILWRADSTTDDSHAFEIAVPRSSLAPTQ